MSLADFWSFLDTPIALESSKMNSTPRFVRGIIPLNRDGLGGGKSQIVRTPLRVKHNSVGKPDWIFSPDLRVFMVELRFLNKKISFIAIYSIF